MRRRDDWSVTVATNMAGRGVDIMLGGNPEELTKQEMHSAGLAEEALSRAGVLGSLRPADRRMRS